MQICTFICTGNAPTEQPTTGAMTKTSTGLTNALAIVVPCYNEFERFPIEDFRNFLRRRPDIALCLVDDASSDNTRQHFETLQAELPQQVYFLVNSRNLGKAGSVRKGIQYCYQEGLAPHLAYLDADLATSLEECASFLKYMDRKSFVFASRILRVGAHVERKFSRFLIGRIIATAISNSLRLNVYDTQCGCKLFKASLTPVLFDSEFRSRWLFDVELFSRIMSHFGPQKALAIMEEVPVKRWVDQGDSRVKLSYFFKLWIDLWKIRKAHRKAMKPWGKYEKSQEAS